MKRGRFSKDEIVYITKHHQTMSVEDVAAELNRDAESVKNFIRDKLGESLQEKREIQALYDLKGKPQWRDIQGQFNKHELDMFEYHWGRIVTQFRDDVLPTEELQIIDAIKLELLMNRALREQQVNAEQVRSYEKLINDEKEKPVEYQDRDYVFNLERQTAVLRAAQESLNRDYKDLGLKKSAMLKDMKATREQRIKRLEDSKSTFIGWVTDLMVSPEKRHELGVEMEKMRLAMNKERKSLSEWHQYEDKMVDQPFLTPDSVKE
jgi:hypothetical protein